MLAKSALTLGLLAMLLAMAYALPVAPTGIELNALNQGVEISWQHPEEGLSFRVYRGTDFNDAAAIAELLEKRFLDETVEENEIYFYFVTAIDSNSEESEESLGYRIKWQGRLPPAVGGELFSLTIVEPKNRRAYFGDTIYLVFQVNSTRLQELGNPRAMLLNEGLGLTQEFEFDSESHQFKLTLQLPEQPEFEGPSINYAYEVTAVAELDGQELFDSKTLDISLIPKSFINVENLLLLLSIVFVPLAIAGTIAFVWWRWALQRKAVRDEIRLELIEVFKERAVWKHDFLRRRVSQEQYAEKERELQGKQIALEAKLGLHKKGLAVKVNPFEGYSPAEIQEVYGLVKTIKKRKKGMNRDQFRAFLVGRGKSERVAKKAAELIYKK